MRKLKHGSVRPKGSRGRAESPLVAAAAAILPAPLKVKKQECALRRGGGGERKAPLLAPAGAKSLRFGKEPLCLKDQQLGRAHLARQCVEGW